ncbi:TPA: pilus assembly protein [Escherichia coli]|nr:pilus assembly protein [Escherichia coli]HCI2385843.1 pilus assembly protein [Escherichia coli]HCI7207933.1 pilus assembly protein [Escherichia coli]HCI7721517.1 pilus assembly protein [Escherichia coli]HCO3547629.1 pilus assembly protein [Escherichia coli]
MHLIFKHTKINNKKEEKGLSLIESAMVLALAATVTAGVMFYYQSASDSNKTQSAISEVMSATSAINGLYIGQSGYTGLEPAVLLNSSAIPENYKNTTTKKIYNPFGGELKVGSATNGAFGYYLALEGLPKSACISLATLNLGTSATGYGIFSDSNSLDNMTFEATLTTGKAKNKPISPSDAAGNAGCKDGNGNVVAYFMK